ncbi:MAG: TolC family outer membrane protein [Hyphomicrobiaceae bacterium]|nr:TolC family outer membrane protein [Hyphomicrobiaceae bacterium]
MSWCSQGPCRRLRLAALLCVLAGIHAGAASAQSLIEAARSAYEKNPRLAAERARQRATDEEVARAYSAHRPVVTGTADVGYQHIETRPPLLADGTVHPRGYAVTASQPVFRGFRTVNGVRVAEATVKAGRETLRTVEQSVLLEAVTTYMDVVRDQATVRLRENNVVVLDKELRAARDRFNVGVVSRTDVAQAEARRAAAVSALELTRANLQSSRAAFERTVGYEPMTLRDRTQPYAKLPKSLDAAIAITSQEHPSVVATIYNEAAARSNIDLIRGELLPSVRLDASHSRRYDTSNVTEEQEVTTVTGRLTVPLYEGGEVHARVRAAKHTHIGRLQQVEQARNEMRAATIAAWSQLIAARAQIESDRVQVAALETALAGVRAEERAGQRTLLDVLNAELEALNARVQLVVDDRNVVVASYAVLAAIGRLSIEALGGSDIAYDAEENYEIVHRKWWGLSITHADGRREQHDLWPGKDTKKVRR